jgi:hypothetical protein
MTPSELILRKTLPVIINSFNQPSYLLNLIKKLEANEFKNIIILDNNSTNPDLLKYYQTTTKDTSHTILYYNNNNGPRYFHSNYIFKILGGVPHLYTDPDIDFNQLSDDFITTLLYLSDKYSSFKVGCALEIPSENEIKSDIFYIAPHLNNRKFSIKEWESQFWQNEIESDVFDAAIDTTLHLFNPKYFNDNTDFISGLRIARNGFTIKHIPWYKNDFMSVEEKIFYKNLAGNWSNY